MKKKSRTKLIDSSTTRFRYNGTSYPVRNGVCDGELKKLYSTCKGKKLDFPTIKQSKYFAQKWLEVRSFEPFRGNGNPQVNFKTRVTSRTLKAAVEALLAKHSLSLHRIRGQGYDGASNMRGEFNGLKALILKDNPQAFYIHCFAHQLQLCLVAVAKNHWQVKHLFEMTSRIVNTVGASCKRNDTLKNIQRDKILFHLSSGELDAGRGLNQETNLHRAGDTRWNSHFQTLISLTKMYASVLEVLEIVKEEGIHDQQSVEAGVLINAMKSFDFVLTLHLMIDILGITNELSQALQRKDQDIINAMKLVQVSKQRLQMMRENEWVPLLEEVTRFCNIFEIEVPNMDSKFKARGRSG
ncbi:zinc finger MYM-type protein 1-like [Dendrobium catenatum]|uniref:zinc finger MYM-type protein 1-like n=1 Tax=Dendrobium catenatum TaxID=906689 RepID=UPI00109FF992|nr:zinc finger MYM-type protein 1-like [Dendrobium catenatum]